MTEKKEMILTVGSGEKFELLACKPEYGRASNGLPYSLIMHDHLAGGHEMAQFISLVMRIASENTDRSPEEVIERAACVTKLAMARGIAEGWMTTVPSHDKITKALAVGERITGTDNILEDTSP